VSPLPFDLVILDMKLRKMEETEVLAELRRHRAGVKAIMLTGYPTAESARLARQLGAVGYCVKPVDKEELEALVGAVLDSPGAEDGGAGAADRLCREARSWK